MRTGLNIRGSPSATCMCLSRWKRATSHLEVTGQLGEGKLVFIADSDLAGLPATLTVPANSQVLTGVQIVKPLRTHFWSSCTPCSEC